MDDERHGTRLTRRADGRGHGVEREPAPVAVPQAALDPGRLGFRGLGEHARYGGHVAMGEEGRERRPGQLA